MKLIVEIDKKDYETLKRLEQKIKDRAEEGFIDRFEIAIMNGIPLKEEFKKIKDEIEEQKLDVDLDIGNEIIYNNAINDVLQIIDRHIS